MSCSRVLTSEYSHLTQASLNLDKNHPLNLSNAVFGIFFYFGIILYPVHPFTLIPFRKILLISVSLFALVIETLFFVNKIF